MVHSVDQWLTTLTTQGGEAGPDMSTAVPMPNTAQTEMNKSVQHFFTTTHNNPNSLQQQWLAINHTDACHSLHSKSVSTRNNSDSHCKIFRVLSPFTATSIHEPKIIVRVWHQHMNSAPTQHYRAWSSRVRKGVSRPRPLRIIHSLVLCPITSHQELTVLLLQ